MIDVSVKSKSQLAPSKILDNSILLPDQDQINSVLHFNELALFVQKQNKERKMN